MGPKISYPNSDHTKYLTIFDLMTKYCLIYNF